MSYNIGLFAHITFSYKRHIMEAKTVKTLSSSDYELYILVYLF